MFQYNGVQYTLQDVIETANSLGLTLSEYLEKNPEVKEIAELSLIHISEPTRPY